MKKKINIVIENYPNGDVFREHSLLGNLKDGEQKIYYPNGNILECEVWEMGEIKKKSQYFKRNKRLYIEIKFEEMMEVSFKRYGKRKNDILINRKRTPDNKLMIEKTFDFISRNDGAKELILKFEYTKRIEKYKPTKVSLTNVSYFNPSSTMKDGSPLANQSDMFIFSRIGGFGIREGICKEYWTPNDHLLYGLASAGGVKSFTTYKNGLREGKFEHRHISNLTWGTFVNDKYDGKISSTDKDWKYMQQEGIDVYKEVHIFKEGKLISRSRYKNGRKQNNVYK